MLRTQARIERSLPFSVRCFWAVNVALAILCVLLMRGVNFYVLHKGWPYTTPFLPFYQFWDFRLYKARFLFFHSPQFFSTDPHLGLPFEYPAAVALLYRLFYSMGSNSIRPYLTLSALAVLALAFLFLRELLRKGILPRTAILFVSCCLLCSYPFWCEALLGNTEVWIFVLVSAAILAYTQGKSYGAAVLIGVAAGMKLYPAVYLGLFLPRRQYKQMAVSVLTAVLLNVVGLWAVCPDIAVSMRGIAAGLTENRNHYMLHYLPEEAGIDHSLFGFLKCCYTALRHNSNIPHGFLNAYFLCAATVGLTLYFFRAYRLPLLNQIAVLSVVSVLFPPTSHDYTLMHLYVPFALVVLFALDHAVDRCWQRVLLPIFLCFGMLFSVEAEIIFRHRQFSGQLKAAVLVVLLALVLRFPFSSDEQVAVAVTT